MIKDPDPYLWLKNPEDPKTNGSGSGTLVPTQSCLGLHFGADSEQVDTKTMVKTHKDGLTKLIITNKK